MKNVLFLSVLFFLVSFGQEQVKSCDDREIRGEGNLKDGEKDGKWTFYFEDGSVWSEGNYKDGKEHGEFIYFGTGNKEIFSKQELRNYKNGILEGQYIHYFETGEISSIRNYADGKLDGEHKFYDMNGKIFWEGNYEDGELINGDFVKSEEPYKLF